MPALHAEFNLWNGELSETLFFFTELLTFGVLLQQQQSQGVTPYRDLSARCPTGTRLILVLRDISPPLDDRGRHAHSLYDIKQSSWKSVIELSQEQWLSSESRRTCKDTDVAPWSILSHWVLM